MIRAQQEAEREPGDQGALGIEAAGAPALSAGVLGQQCGAQRDGGLGEADLEVESRETVDQERREDRDLIEARIEAPGG